MRETDSILQQFGEFLLKEQLVREKAAPWFVRYVRQFLARPASDEPLADQVRRFCEDLERTNGVEEWQVRQAEHALRIYFVNFLDRTDWCQRPASSVVDEKGRTNPRPPWSKCGCASEPDTTPTEPNVPTWIGRGASSTTLPRSSNAPLPKLTRGRSGTS